MHEEAQRSPSISASRFGRFVLSGRRNAAFGGPLVEIVTTCLTHPKSTKYNNLGTLDCWATKAMRSYQSLVLPRYQAKVGAYKNLTVADSGDDVQLARSGINVLRGVANVLH